MSIKEKLSILKSIDEILASLEISKYDHEVALSVSDNNDFQIHSK